MLLPNRLYATCITLIAALLLSACQKETLPIADGNKTVNITLSTKVGGDGSTAASPEDAIHTLRIYAFYGDDNELIGYHYVDDIPSLGTYSFSMPLNLSYKEDFPTGSVMAKFYVVANEGGAKINGIFPEAVMDPQTGLWKWKTDVTITPQQLSALLITGYGTKTESDITGKGLPMSFKDDNVTITTETNQSLEFGMKRAVVKLETTFTNKGSAVTVTDIRFGNFQADKGYLFPYDGEIVPDDVSYNTKPVVLSPNLHISQGGTGKVTYYQLPSAARNSEYTFGFSLDNGTSFGPSELKPNNGGSIESIDRNHGLGINVTVEDDNIRFSVPDVQPWRTGEGGIIIVE